MPLHLLSMPTNNGHVTPGSQHCHHLLLLQESYDLDKDGDDAILSSLTLSLMILMIN